MEVFATDISKKKEFERIGYHYEMVWSDEENHIYLFEMTGPGPYKKYELVQGLRHKNPDGNIVYIYPSDEQFGIYGWYICGPEETCQKNISEKYHSLLKRKEK